MKLGFEKYIKRFCHCALRLARDLLNLAEGKAQIGLFCAVAFVIKIATFAKPQTVLGNPLTKAQTRNFCANNRRQNANPFARTKDL